MRSNLMIKFLYHILLNPRDSVEDKLDDYHKPVLIISVILCILFLVYCSHIFHSAIILLIGLAWLVSGAIASYIDNINRTVLIILMFLVIIPFLIILGIILIYLEYITPIEYNINEFFYEKNFEDYDKKFETYEGFSNNSPNIDTT